MTDVDRTDFDDPVEVRLAVPARPRFLRVARLAAAALVVDLGADLEGVEDLRVAVDELSAAIIDAAPDGSVLELRFALDGNCLTVQGEVTGRWNQPLTLHPVAVALLEFVADDYAIHDDDDRRGFRLEVHAGGADASS